MKTTHLRFSVTPELVVSIEEDHCVHKCVCCECYDVAVCCRYTPSQQGVAFNSGAKQRIIRMVEVQKDPMEPPKFK